MMPHNFACSNKRADKWPDAAQKLSAVTADLSVEITRRAVPAYNVIGVIEGNDPKLEHEYIVIGAHYDHLGRGGHDGSVARNPNDIHPAPMTTLQARQVCWKWRAS